MSSLVNTFTGYTAPTFASGRSAVVSHSVLEQGMKDARAYVPTVAQTLNFKLLDKLAKGFFRPVLEDFLIGVMAIDFVALWLPRAFTALFRGAMDYDPVKDVKAQTKSGMDEKLYILGQRAKRLNWPNFFEEWWREFASGPGFFMWPTICFLAFRNTSKNRSSIQMAKPTIEGAANHFKDYLKTNNINDPTKVNFAEMMKSMVDWDTLFGPRISGEKRAESTKLVEGQLKEFAKLLEERAALLNKHASAAFPFTPQRGRFNQITKRLGDFIERKKDGYTSFVEAIDQINTRYAGERHMNQDFLPLKFTWSAEQDTKTSAKEFINRMSQWHDFVDHVRRKATQTNKTMLSLIDPMVNKLLHAKGVYAVITTTLTVGFLFKLVHWTQSHDTYVANRTQKLENLFGLPGKKAEWVERTAGSRPTHAAAIPLSTQVAVPSAPQAASAPQAVVPTPPQLMMSPPPAPQAVEVHA